jgi:hypothetical protein
MNCDRIADDAQTRDALRTVRGLEKIRCQTRLSIAGFYEWQVRAVSRKPSLTSEAGFSRT